MVTSVPSCYPQGLVAVLNQAQYQGPRPHIKVDNQQVVPYHRFPDRPKIPNQHQATLPGTGDPKTNKLQPLTGCAAGERADLGSLWLGSQETEE